MGDYREGDAEILEYLADVVRRMDASLQSMAAQLESLQGEVAQLKSLRRIS